MPSMNAYLFTSIATFSQLRSNDGRYGPGETFQTWDGSPALIVLDGNPELAQEQFEAWLHRQTEGENPRTVEIKRIAAAQFVDQLLAESGGASLDWRGICEQFQAQTEALAVDDFEQGYWADVEQCVPPGKLSANLEALQRDLPEDIRSGLNWSADKRFTFVLSVLTPPPPPDYSADVDRAYVSEPPPAEQSDETSDEGDAAEVQRLLALYPQAMDKEAAALIQARNSVVAAWLWRRYAAGTPLAGHAIRIDPFCGVMGLAPEEDKSGKPAE